ncbi:hypothetical protein C427_4703 [Paraglaciecola psychrophila 170]|uniref:Uncharacterized protein n=1 Tax=Paraglaciecola psychrophila 170 TaxID=1129794 RepID=K6Z477_9ALTE|nr:hypothetical protein C427_4703 [Paraglaciecola psychrophila 170]GAC39854.1 hypothetical protein GPSY_4243 [Paraglaciecola psychrophila 170]
MGISDSFQFVLFQLLLSKLSADKNSQIVMGGSFNRLMGA